MGLTMQVQQERCTGCGRCLEVCPTGAIRLSDGVAVVEASLCRGCRVCLDACPSGAIRAVEEVPEAVPEPAAVQKPAQARFRVSTPSRPAASGVQTVLTAALDFMAREVVPGVVPAMLMPQKRRRRASSAAGTWRSSNGRGHRCRRRRHCRRGW